MASVTAIEDTQPPQAAIKGNAPAARTGNKVNVTFQRNELRILRETYILIRDCLAGESVIKRATVRYLPKPNPDDTSKANSQRYLNYLKRAVFYNVTSRTLAGLVGQIFLRPPMVNVPSQIQGVVEDATGEGVPCEQLAKSCANYVLAFGRAGLLIDYPSSEQATTQAMIDAGDMRATFKLFAPWEVINWRTIARGAEVLLSLVVIQEGYNAFDDGFEVRLGMQWRVLRLMQPTGDPTNPADAPSAFVQGEVWQLAPQATNYVLYELYFPRDVNGDLLTEIPFTFVGSENNNSDPDNPPLQDMAYLNIGHFRNSADYEESCYLCGQPTPWVSGVTKQWLDEILEGQLHLGARGAIPLPLHGAAGLLQAQPNSMPKEAMDAKERQMVALGAKLIQQATVQRTATETDIENTAESSTLGASAKNVASAFEFALQWACKFMGGDPETVEYTLNTEFDLTYMDFNTLLAVVKTWQAGAMTVEEMRDNLRRAGLASEPDDTAIPKLEAAQKAAATAAANKPANNNVNTGGSDGSTAQDN